MTRPISHVVNVGDHAGPLDRGRLAARVRAGEVTVGTFVGAASPLVAEVCAAAGCDWLLLDLEHGSGGEEEVRAVVPVAGGYGVPTVVRVESGERIRAGRVLDAGAAGVMFPRLEGAPEAHHLIRNLRYPPDGHRGVATYNRMCRFGLDPGALDHADDDVLGIVQIESVGALREVDQLAALDGVDVLFVGPRDLRRALETSDRPDAPGYDQALDSVLDAARRHGKAAGILVMTGADAHAFIARGWRFVAVGSDATILASALAAHLADARHDITSGVRG
ncbi:MAG: HpcH/HpaI aldolase family protein [Actinomycetales bacterium]